jgi:DNA repair protein RecO (recombination protein O)
MPPVKDQALCIRKHDYSETSQIVTLFGHASGKVRAMAKGCRRSRGKFSGGFEVLSAGSMIFIPPHGESALATLTEWELEESFPGLRRNLLALNCAQYAADILADFTEDLDPHPRLYESLYAALKQWQQSPRPDVVLLVFELILLQEAGLCPSWHNCCACGKPLLSTPRLYFSSRTGGMLCRECEPAVVEKRFVQLPALQLLQDSQYAASAPIPVVGEAHELLSYHERELLGKQSSTMVFVNQLLRQQLRK